MLPPILLYLQLKMFLSKEVTSPLNRVVEEESHMIDESDSGQSEQMRPAESQGPIRWSKMTTMLVKDMKALSISSDEDVSHSEQSEDYVNAHEGVINEEDWKLLKQQVSDRKGLDELSLEYKEIFENLMSETEVKTYAKKSDKSKGTVRMNVIKIKLDVKHRFIYCLLANGYLTSCRITCYSMQNYSYMWSHRISDKNGHVVLNDIEQTSCGDLIAVPYTNDGEMRLWLKDIGLDSDQGEEDLDVNKICGLLKKGSKPIIGFYNPMVTCCFVPKNIKTLEEREHCTKSSSYLFVQSFYRPEQCQSSVIYDIYTKQVVWRVGTKMQNSTKLNFPIKSFYSAEYNEIYTFYRQGHCVQFWNHANPKENHIHQRKIIEKDLGHMVLIYEKVLVVRSSNSILFFKKDDDEDMPGHMIWKKYFTLSDVRGEIDYTSGLKRLQIATEEKIRFYYLHPDSLIPIFENIMLNFIPCSNILFGGKPNQLNMKRNIKKLEPIAITYKFNEPDFRIFTRSAEHNFNVFVSNENYEGSVAQVLYSQLSQSINLPRHLDHKCINPESHLVEEIAPAKYFVISKPDLTVDLHRIGDFSKQKKQMQVEPVFSVAEECEILYIQSSHDHRKIAMLLGRRGMRKSITITEIQIWRLAEQDFEINLDDNINTDRMTDLNDDFQYMSDIIDNSSSGYVKECSVPYRFNSGSVCEQFFFDGVDDEILVFFTMEQIIKFRYKDNIDSSDSEYDDERDDFNGEMLYEYWEKLKDPPRFGVFNRDQTKCIVTSEQDMLFIDLESQFELDIDKKENISDVQNVVADSRHFYVLANKKNQKIGFFLFIIDFATSSDPDQEYTYLINWANKTPIQQVDLNFLADANYDSDLRKDAFVESDDIKEQEESCENQKELARQRLGAYDDQDENIMRSRTVNSNFKDNVPGSTLESKRNAKKKLRRYLVVSYKAEGMNTYNVFVFDIQAMEIKFWYECYHLYELPIKGYLLPASKDFIILSKEGMNVINLGQEQMQTTQQDYMRNPSDPLQNFKIDHNLKFRTVIDAKGKNQVLHSLGACNYLKIESSNHIYFKHQFYENRRICIQNKYQDSNEFTQFDDIYSIKIDQPSLQELLVIQSIYLSRNTNDVNELVEGQPNPQIFFKVFLELRMKNLLAYLAFDRKSMTKLLSKKSLKQHRHRMNNEEYQYPVFFKNQDHKSAIDIALERNQISSLQLMINYVLRYQNSYVYAHLFTETLVEMLIRGVNCKELFESDIFRRPIIYYEWPSMHPNQDSQYKPYNRELFQLRQNYEMIFPELARIEKHRSRWQRLIKQRLKNDADSLYSEDDNLFFDQNNNSINIQFNCCGRQQADKNEEKLYAIEHHLNMLPSMKQTEESIIDALLANEENLEIFGTKAVRDLIDFRWLNYAKQSFYYGLAMHSFLLIALMWFISHHYFSLIDEKDTNLWLLILLASMFIYPTKYELAQFRKLGTSYFYTGQNQFDLFFLVTGYSNIGSQLYLGPQFTICKAMIVMLLMCILFKYFFYLRIFEDFSAIITMIVQCLLKLRQFLIFFAMLQMFFSAMISVLGPNPQIEYKLLDPFFANIIVCLRYSVGDLANFQLLERLTKHEQVVFWYIWVLIFFLGCIVFLNFIIAEIGDIYNEVSSTLENQIYKERASMVKEYEDTLSFEEKHKNKTNFPKFYIIRSFSQKIEIN